MDYTDKILNLKDQLGSIIYKEWVDQTVFSSRWWFLFSALIIGYAVWIFLLDKKRILEIILFGSFIAVMNVSFDIVAVLYGLWTYKVRFFPIMPSVFPFDFSFIPVVFMLFYQYFTPWKKFIWGAAVAAALYSFMFLPLLKHLDILLLQNWNYFYSFLLRFSEIILARIVIGFLKKIQLRHSEKLIHP